MPAELKTERIGPTLVLTLSDPSSRNALSAQALIAGVEALNVAEADDELRCIVLQGAGSNFSSGGDMAQLAATKASDCELHGDQIDLLHRFVEAVRAHPKPVIAAVEGQALGGGFALALACDLVVAAEDARFLVQHGQVGLSPDAGISFHLMQSLPRQRVLQFIWLAEPLRTRELFGCGLVNWVTDSGMALSEALNIATRLAAMAPNALASVKELIGSWPKCSLAQQLSLEREHFLENLRHDNASHGLQAFVDQRSPAFR